MSGREWRRMFCAEAFTLGIVAFGHRLWFLAALAVLGVGLVVCDVLLDRHEARRGAR